MDCYQAHRVVVVIDLVESVRLMNKAEGLAIELWREFVQRATAAIAGLQGGRLVKSLGDGLLVEFTQASNAIEFALLAHGIARQVAVRVDRAEVDVEAVGFAVRAGVHSTPVVIDAFDIYGSGVNLAARLATLAGPTETVMSAEAKHELAGHPHLAFHDLGECYLKHFEQPVRAFKVTTMSAVDRVRLTPRSHIELLPSVAVLPFTQQVGGDDTHILGNVISDDLIAALSSNPALRVLSRMSTMNLRDTSWSPVQLRQALNASYVVNGGYRVAGDSIFIMIELCDTVRSQIVTASRGATTIGELFTGAARLITDVAIEIAASVVSAEVSRIRDMEVGNLADYTLYVGAINLLDKLNRQEFLKSRELLGHLQERAPRQAAPHAMQAKWHVMNLIQRWSSDRARDTQAAQAAARRALELNADYPFALAIDGLADVWLRTDLDSARRKYEAALAINPNEVHAWAFLSGVHSYQGDGVAAEFAARQALALSPLDPALYYFEAYAALAAIVNDQAAMAVHWAASSLMKNGKHLPSHRLLVIGHALAGEGAKAKQAAIRLNGMEPHGAVSDYLGQYPGRNAKHAAEIDRALRMAGVVD